jgi:thiamine-phosphate pyrophosphorylase
MSGDAGMARAARRRLDLSLYLVVGAGDTRGRDLETVVRAAVAGGVTVVQLREKAAATRDMLARAQRLKALLDPLGVPLIVNDRLDVALAVGAAGVHLGQDDMPPDLARPLLGPGPILGLSVSDADEARTADPAQVDYVGIGTAFETGTKADAGAAIGPEGVRRLRAQVGLPSVAIGGIHAGNAAQLGGTGVEGIAVVSAIAGADDPEAAARELRRAFGG